MLDLLPQVWSSCPGKMTGDKEKERNEILNLFFDRLSALAPPTWHLVGLTRPGLGEVALAGTGLSILVLATATGAMLQTLVVAVPPLCPLPPT